MRGSYISGDMIGRVTILAEMNMRGAEMKVHTTIPVAIWRGKQQLQIKAISSIQCGVIKYNPSLSVVLLKSKLCTKPSLYMSSLQS